MSASGPVAGAVVNVKVAKPLGEGTGQGGYWFDFTSDSKGVVTAYTPASWQLHAGSTYDVKIAAITKAGYTWDNRQGVNMVSVTV